MESRKDVLEMVERALALLDNWEADRLLGRLKAGDPLAVDAALTWGERYLEYSRHAACRTPEAKFGAKLRELRKRSGLSQVELSALVGCTQGYVSDLETKTRLPDPVMFQRVADALRVEGEELLLWIRDASETPCGTDTRLPYLMALIQIGLLGRDRPVEAQVEVWHDLLRSKFTSWTPG